MAKNAVTDWDTTAANNQDVGGIAIADNTMATGDVDDAIREVMAQIAASSLPDLDGGTIDGTVIGGTTPAAATFTSVTIDNNTPNIYLNELDGTAGYAQVAFNLTAGLFAIQTLTDAGAYVSNDYLIARDASGATSHSFRIGNTEKFSVGSGGATVAGQFYGSAANNPVYSFTGDTSTGLSLTGTGEVTLACGGTTHGVTAKADEFKPLKPLTMSLGTGSFPWKEVFAVAGSINTSDINLKTDIVDINEAETRVAQAVKGLLRRYRWKNAVEEKGDAARYHFGVMAQEVVAAFEAEGLDAHDYGMICLDDDGNEGQRYGVRYSELLAFMIAAM